MISIANQIISISNKYECLIIGEFVREVILQKNIDYQFEEIDIYIKDYNLINKMYEDISNEITNYDCQKNDKKMYLHNKNYKLTVNFKNNYDMKKYLCLDIFCLAFIYFDDKYSLINIFDIKIPEEFNIVNRILTINQEKTKLTKIHFKIINDNFLEKGWTVKYDVTCQFFNHWIGTQKLPVKTYIRKGFWYSIPKSLEGTKVYDLILSL